MYDDCETKPYLLSFVLPQTHAALLLSLCCIVLYSLHLMNDMQGVYHCLMQVNTCLVSSVCTRGISYRGQDRGLLTCYPDTDLAIAKELMEAKGIKQLPVVQRCRGFWKERKRRIVAILHYDSIRNCLRFILDLCFQVDNQNLFFTIDA